MKRCFKVAAVFGALMLPAVSSAFAIEVTEEVVINAPVGAVWGKVGSWCAIKAWHPAVVKCVEKREGDNLRRVLSLDGGGTIVERLTNENETSYSYVIESGPLPVDKYQSTISVAPDKSDASKTKLTWTGTFDAKGKTDKEAGDVIRGVYSGGLGNVVKDMNK